jgi:putative nucleotidyltransferase with HDIG domain
MAKRVLFVDDETSILGIYQMLQPFLGEDYTVFTASSGKEALALLEKDRFDVVVSDLTMPKMSGAELLNQVSQRWPSSARVVVSGFADELTIAKCLMVAHRYFSKPFDPMALTVAVQKLSEARDTAINEKVREFVGKIDALPTHSETYLKLTKALGSTHASMREVSSLIEQDPALTSKVLQTVNSAMFGPARRICTVQEAVQLIGFQVLRALVLGIQVFDFFQNAPLEVSLNSLWSHSLETALHAKRLASLEDLAGSACDEAFLAGLLHDIGKVALAASSPTDYQVIWTQHHQNTRDLREAEFATFGATHADVGAYLLRLWGLPEPIIEAVERHHNLDLVSAKTFSPLVAVYAAQELSPSRVIGSSAVLFFEQAGFGPRIPIWLAALEQTTLGTYRSSFRPLKAA